MDDNNDVSSNDRKPPRNKEQAERLRALTRERLADVLLGLVPVDEWPSAGAPPEKKKKWLEEVVESLKASTSHEEFAQKLDEVEKGSNQDFGGPLFARQLTSALSSMANSLSSHPEGSERLMGRGGRANPARKSERHSEWRALLAPMEARQQSGETEGGELVFKVGPLSKTARFESLLSGLLLIGGAAHASANMAKTLAEKCLASLGAGLFGVAKAASGAALPEMADAIKLRWAAGVAKRTPDGALEDQLAKGKRSLALDFGFARIGIEEDAVLNVETQIRIVSMARVQLSRAATHLGVDPRKLGLDGWSLTISGGGDLFALEESIGYIEPDHRMLNFNVSAGADTVIHEWVHMLDAGLAKLAKVRSKEIDGEESEAYERVASARMFTEMSAEEQARLLPQAALGYRLVAGAAQGVLGGDPFDKMQQMLNVVGAQAGALILDGMAFGKQRLRDSDASPDLVSLCIRAGFAVMKVGRVGKSFNFKRCEEQARAWAIGGEQDSWSGLRFDELATAVAKSLGKTMEQARLAVGEGLSALIEEKALLQKMNLSLGPRGEFRNPDSPFVIGSQESDGFDQVYWSSSAEMMARTIGRQQSIRGQAKLAAATGGREHSALSWEQQKQVARGWGMMTDCAGLGAAELGQPLAKRIAEAGLAKWREGREASQKNNTSEDRQRDGAGTLKKS